MQKDELVKLADDVANIARRRLGYDYAGVLILRSAELFPEGVEIRESHAVEVLFKAYDSYANKLDSPSRESLRILKIYMLLDLAEKRPKCVPHGRRLAIRARLAHHKAKGLWRLRGRKSGR